MDVARSSTGEVALPAMVFAALRREIEEAVGELPMIRAFHAAGFDAGKRMAPLLKTAMGGDPHGVTEVAFWNRFSQFFGRRGWGSLSHEAGSDAVGILSSVDWAESRDREGAEGCAFSSGVLSGILTELAGGPIAVLETSCRGRGDPQCRFAFGSEAAIHEMYGSLVEGATLSDVLESL